MIRPLAAAAAFALAATLPPAVAVGDGATVLRLALRRTRDVEETELYARREQAVGLGPVALVYGASVTDRGARWAGVGLSLSGGLGGGWSVDASVMPGPRADGGCPDLGSPLEIRSALAVSRRAGRGRLGVGIDHLSNANSGDRNPGSDAVFLRYRLKR